MKRYAKAHGYRWQVLHLDNKIKRRPTSTKGVREEHGRFIALVALGLIFISLPSLFPSERTLYLSTGFTTASIPSLLSLCFYLCITLDSIIHGHIQFAPLCFRLSDECKRKRQMRRLTRKTFCVVACTICVACISALLPNMS